MTGGAGQPIKVTQLYYKRDQPGALSLAGVSLSTLQVNKSLRKREMTQCHFHNGINCLPRVRRRAQTSQRPERDCPPTGHLGATEENHHSRGINTAPGRTINLYLGRPLSALRRAQDWSNTWWHLVKNSRRGEERWRRAQAATPGSLFGGGRLIYEFTPRASLHTSVLSLSSSPLCC